MSGIDGVRLRPLRWWDIDAILPMEHAAFGATAWSAGQFWGELAQPTRAYVLAEDDRGPVGYAGVHALAPEADVQTLAVDPRARGKGLGGALLEWLTGVARERGCTRLFLEVGADNDPARTLYRSAGFEEIARRAGYYGPGADAVIMRAYLRGGQ